MNLVSLRKMLRLEANANLLWNELSSSERKAYAAAYPETAFLDHLKKGALHHELDVPEDKPIPEGKLDKALHSDNKLEKKRAQFAKTAKSWHH